MDDRLRSITSGKAEPKRGKLGGWLAGRASRREYWLWTVLIILVSAAVSFLGFPAAAIIVSWPYLLVAIRRAHDLGWSGWLPFLVNLGIAIVGTVIGILVGDVAQAVVMIGQLILLIGLGVLRGQASENEFGPPAGVRTISLESSQ